ncbi:MAG: UvrB/UvrC motif-containing protein [bacterium]|nr:UvrB/UvrC motif-containing protein [bacterium]
MIPSLIEIKNNTLPDEPGVYLYYAKDGTLLYVGKATSLKKRVGSYFNKAHDNRIGKLVAEIARIDYIETPTVLEALVLEANEIKARKPKYNILMRDDKSYLYLAFTNEGFPKPLYIRGHDLKKFGVNPFAKTLSKRTKEKFIAVYGPFTSGYSLKKSMEYLRKIFPWTECDPPSVTGKKRPCFYRHIRICPGVCTGEIDRTEYKKIIQDLMLFFEGKKTRIVTSMKKEMETAAKDQRYEHAAEVRNKIFALEHIRDVALITKEDVELPFSEDTSRSSIDLDGRIEAYDISNISGTSAVGVMTVFVDGRPSKKDYRKFKIKTVTGSNDVGMMEEVLRRRLRRAELHPQAWPLPEVMVIDGGKPQVNRVQTVLDELGVSVPILGLAKGADRKQDRMIFDRSNSDLAAIALRGKETFQKVRDEAHRFAVKYHRELRRKRNVNVVKTLKKRRR